MSIYLANVVSFLRNTYIALLSTLMNPMARFVKQSTSMTFESLRLRKNKKPLVLLVGKPSVFLEPDSEKSKTTTTQTSLSIVKMKT